MIFIANPSYVFIRGAYANDWNRNGFRTLSRWDSEYAWVRRDGTKAAIRSAESHLKAVRFGSSAWWIVRDEIRALQREINSLRRHSTYRDLTERGRIQGDYYRTHGDVLDIQAKRANVWMGQAKFGSREWWSLKAEKYALQNEKSKLYSLYAPWRVDTIDQLYRQQREINVLRKRTIEKQIRAEEIG